MANALCFIIGEYTIPLDLPIIYVTDSNNSRTLQCKNGNKFTHHQGIDHSIANCLIFNIQMAENGTIKCTYFRYV